MDREGTGASGPTLRLQNTFMFNSKDILPQVWQQTTSTNHSNLLEGSAWTTSAKRSAIFYETEASIPCDKLFARRIFNFRFERHFRILIVYGGRKNNLSHLFFLTDREKFSMSINHSKSSQKQRLNNEACRPRGGMGRVTEKKN